MAAVSLIASDVKLAHSVFAMPFALLAAFMAAEQAYPIPPDDDEAFWPGMYLLSKLIGPLTLIVLAMVFARTVAMLANRWIDREIDKRNPRTASRPLASGRLRPEHAIAALVFCAIAFMLVCAAFGVLYDNWWPAILGLPILGWISAYGYLKRFTALCHVYLGSSLAISPIAAAMAIDPSALTTQPSLWLLAGMVLCWVAGFDIIYALQDVAIDREQGLHSMPSRLGERGAMWVSRCLHGVALLSLCAAAMLDRRFGTTFMVGCCLVTALLVIEHATVMRWGTLRIALVFFTINGIISCVLGLLGIIDITLV